MTTSSRPWASPGIVEAGKASRGEIKRWKMPEFGVDTAIASSGSPQPELQSGVCDGEPSAPDQRAADERAAGFDAGYADGLREARQQAEAQREQLQSLLSLLENPAQILTGQIAEQLLQLACDISRRVLRSELNVKPELLGEVVQAALRELPPGPCKTRLLMHPQDCELLRRSEWFAGTGGLEMIEDADLAPGNIALETEHSFISAGVDAMLRSVADQCLAGG